MSLAAARNGLNVGPSIDKQRGIGHTDEFSIDLTKASDRRIVWALIVVLSPLWIHMGFPCTFWVQISQWTRIRDLDKNEATRLEALVFIQFSRQVVYYQASRWRHSSIENPRDSVSWDLDIVKDMICAGGMEYVDVHLCPWGAKDPSSGLFYNKAMRFASTFNMKPLIRRCPRNHEHEPIKGVVRDGPFKGRHRSALSGQYPLPLCDAWTSLAQQQILGGRFSR